MPPPGGPRSVVPSAVRPSAAQTPVDAASPFAPTPQAPRKAPVIPPARGGRAGVILVLVLLAAGGVAGGAWWLGNQWKAKLRPPRRPATATRPAEPAPPPAAPPTARPAEPTSEPTEPPAKPTAEAPAVVAEKPASSRRLNRTRARSPNRRPSPNRSPSPTSRQAPPPRPSGPPRRCRPVPRSSAARAPAPSAFARGMEHRGRGEEDLAMYAFEEALRLGGLDAEMRGEAERQYVNIKRKYGFIDVLCDERGIEVLDRQAPRRTDAAAPPAGWSGRDATGSSFQAGATSRCA